MLEFLVERGRFLDRVHFAIDAHAGEASLLPLGHFLAVFALAAAYHGGQQIEPRALWQFHHPVHHIGHRLRLDRQAGSGRIGHAHARPEQAHVVVDLRHSCDGGARIAAGGLLLDGNGRRQSVDMLHIGLLHHLQKLTCIGRKAFDIAPLPLCIDGVESKRTFARAGQAGNDDQAVTRKIDIDPLEVVFARAFDGDFGKSHSRSKWGLPPGYSSGPEGRVATMAGAATNVPTMFLTA